MSNYSAWDDKIHKAMANSTKRKIIDSLNKEDKSFTEIQNSIGDFDNHGKLGYHLRTLREFVELDTKQGKYHLTSRGELLVRMIHNYRSQLSHVPDHLNYALELKAGDHAVALISDNEFKRQVVFPFLKSGISRGYAGVYCASENELDSDVKAIQENGVELDTLPKGAFTIMSAQEWYLRRGKAEPKTMVTNIAKIVREVKSAGFEGLVSAGEAGILIENGFGEECVKYEKSLGRQLSSELYLICLYHDRLLIENKFDQLIMSHGHIISKNLIGKIP